MCDTLGAPSAAHCQGGALRISRRTAVLVAVGLLVVCVAAGFGYSRWASDRRAARHEQAVRDGVAQVHNWVRSWSIDHSDSAPAASIVTMSGLGIAQSNWPTNPYTGQPMHPGTQQGDYQYESTGPTSYRLVGFGSHGDQLEVLNVDTGSE
jgi:hypothetical protein